METGCVGELVVRLAEDRFVVWSDTVDAPTSRVMTGDAMVSFLAPRAEVGMEKAAALVRFATDVGTSDPTVTLDDVLRANRAGPAGTTLSAEEIVRAYSS
jgi:hypothetical protein